MLGTDEKTDLIAAKISVTEGKIFVTKPISAAIGPTGLKCRDEALVVECGKVEALSLVLMVAGAVLAKQGGLQGDKWITCSRMNS